MLFFSYQNFEHLPIKFRDRTSNLKQKVRTCFVIILKVNMKSKALDWKDLLQLKFLHLHLMQ